VDGAQALAIEMHDAMVREHSPGTLWYKGGGAMGSSHPRRRDLMTAVAPILVLLCVLVVILVREKRRRRVSVIAAPRFGTLNLKGADGEALVEADTRALQSVLGVAERSTLIPLKCDVLFVYCDISSDGRIATSGMSLGDLVRSSGATILVVASENPGPMYIACNKTGPFGRVNLVMTLNRRGERFARFFTRLFEDMKRGTSMPLAWVKLASQNPNVDDPEVPGTIFACMAGQVSFRAS